MTKPRIGITMGDPAGVGPEIVAKALCNQRLREACTPVLFGERAVYERVKDGLGLSREIAELGEVQFVDSGTLTELPPIGKVSAAAGRAAYTAIANSVQAAQEGTVHAIATGPINKESLKAGSIDFIGHTEILAGLTGTDEPLTLFVVDQLRIFFLTRHVSLRQALESVTTENVARFSRKAYSELQRLLQIKEPRMALAGLNPHSGEHGLFGTEEMDQLEPAVEILRVQGLDISGPYPGDSIFHRALQGQFDAVISLYHDQGHIAAKMVDFQRTIAMTLGLPFLRTSVDHGTAFDIAGTGAASSVSMVEAVIAAAKYGWGWTKGSFLG